MREKLQAIVINVIKYNDRNNIARLYTLERGLLPVLVRQGTTAQSRSRNAMFTPLSQIEVVANIRHGRDLSLITDVRRTALTMSVNSDPVKIAIAMFISELLSRSIIEEEPNEGLFYFLQHSIDYLDNLERGVANFHICFLFALGHFLGIHPDTNSYSDGFWFDMEDGVFTRGMPAGHRYLKPDDAKALHLVSRMTYRNMHLFRFSREQRDLLLETTLNYYRLHQSSLGSLRSLDVLKQLFAD